MSGWIVERTASNRFALKSSERLGYLKDGFHFGDYKFRIDAQKRADALNKIDEREGKLSLKIALLRASLASAYKFGKIIKPRKTRK